ncbi:unnamed protein product [Acanthoscelides obtectus]|uniref:DDE Tnp4 domain-containing protein n=1 Tax=Acanthoscelides obtectus TaxID=200917 RepID=A0A9P0M0H1_ACAOB|nr:unnamed protein product [Acanthoscelides obtectus]CAK1651438.1 Protein ALP1-like [Acanthoscelides obtectus]
MRELNTYPERFQNFYRMSRECFYNVLALVKEGLEKRSTNFREPICPEERLLITLRYFASGCSFKALSYYFVKGHSTVRAVVHQTAKVIWEKLQPKYMPVPTTAKWMQIADRFHSLWNLPNCIGSIDGKHIRIQAPPRSGSAYINYKGFFSTVLLAVADADGMFVTVDVGEYGRNSDGRALMNSNFGRALQSSNLDLPQPRPIPGDVKQIPFYFTADEAFPLKKNIMKPFSRRELTTNNRRIFNTRLSRGRKSVECSFGMLAAKFAVLNTPIRCTPDKVDILVQAMCVLHNAIKECNGTFTTPQYDNVIHRDSILQLPPLTHSNAKNIREYLTMYLSECAPIPYQDRYCV